MSTLQRLTPGEASTSDQQKSWKTVLAKAILRSSAFKAALRAASERAYVWYMGRINPVLAAMDQVTSWEVVGIATALGRCWCRRAGPRSSPKCWRSSCSQACCAVECACRLPTASVLC